MLSVARAEGSAAAGVTAGTGRSPRSPAVPPARPLPAAALPSHHQRLTNTLRACTAFQVAGGTATDRSRGTARARRRGGTAAGLARTPGPGGARQPPAPPGLGVARWGRFTVASQSRTLEDGSAHNPPLPPPPSRRAASCFLKTTAYPPAGPWHGREGPAAPRPPARAGSGAGAAAGAAGAALGARSPPPATARCPPPARLRRDRDGGVGMGGSGGLRGPPPARPGLGAVLCTQERVASVTSCLASPSRRP